MNYKNVAQLAALAAISLGACKIPETLREPNPDPELLTCQQIREKLAEKVSRPIFMGKVNIPLKGSALNEMEKKAYEQALIDKNCEEIHE